MGAICDKLIERLKAVSPATPRSEGVDNGDWALIDAGDVIIHVFRPEVREFYALEKMWAPADVLAERAARARAAGAAGARRPGGRFKPPSAASCA